MNLKELIKISPKPVKLLATATNGVANSSKLLAVGVIDCNYAGTDMQYSRNIWYLNRPDDVVAQGYEYHKISPEMIRAYSKPYHQIKEELAEALHGATIMTYNTGFQSMFLSQAVDIVESLVMYDWTRLEKSVRNKKVYTDEECADFEAFCRSCSEWNSVPVSRYLKSFNSSPVSGGTRLDQMLDVSLEVFSSVLTQEFEVLKSSSAE